jgi:hypothetical protein
LFFGVVLLSASAPRRDAGKRKAGLALQSRGTHGRVSKPQDVDDGFSGLTEEAFYKVCMDSVDWQKTVPAKTKQGECCAENPRAYDCSSVFSSCRDHYYKYYGSWPSGLEAEDITANTAMCKTVCDKASMASRPLTTFCETGPAYLNWLGCMGGSEGLLILEVMKEIDPESYSKKHGECCGNFKAADQEADCKNLSYHCGSLYLSDDVGSDWLEPWSKAEEAECKAYCKGAKKKPKWCLYGFSFPVLAGVLAVLVVIIVVVITLLGCVIRLRKQKDDGSDSLSSAD